MNRRGFLKAILSSAVAPYVVTTSGVLMPVRRLLEPEWVIWGDGVHDDTLSLQAWLNGDRAVMASGTPVGRVLFGGTYLVSDTLRIHSGQPMREMVANTVLGRIQNGQPIISYEAMNEHPRINGMQLFAG